MKLSEVRKEAREALTGKWGKGVGIVLAFLLFEFVIGFATGLLEENSILIILILIVQTIITIPLSLGLSFAFLKLKRNEEVSSFDFFGLGMDNFSRAWRIVGRTILKMIIPAIILLISAVIFAGIIIYSIVALFLSFETVSQETVIMTGLIYIAVTIYYVYVSLLYVLTSFVAYDNKDMTAREVVAESAKLMKDNRGKFILFELSFLGWMILSIFTLGIGFLWLIPYMQVAKICFYEKLIQVNADVKSEDNTEKQIEE